MNSFTLIAVLICLFAGLQKVKNPKYTFGGDKYRTRFWSSSFFFFLTFLIITGWYCDDSIRQANRK